MGCFFVEARRVSDTAMWWWFDARIVYYRHGWLVEPPLSYLS